MGRFRLDITKKILSDGCHTSELCCGISTKKIIKAQLDKPLNSLEQPHLLNLLWEGGWKRWPPQVPSHPGHFAVLWKTLAEVIRGGHTIYTIFISKTIQIVIIAPVDVRYYTRFPSLSPIRLVMHPLEDHILLLTAHLFGFYQKHSADVSLMLLTSERHLHFWKLNIASYSVQSVPENWIIA